eukprot:3208942-Rhodomonas_salina.1
MPDLCTLKPTPQPVGDHAWLFCTEPRSREPRSRGLSHAGHVTEDRYATPSQLVWSWGVRE